MGAYTTLRITRGKAMGMYAAYILGVVSDDRLEEFMDAYLAPSIRDCSIVPDDCDDNDDDQIY